MAKKITDLTNMNGAASIDRTADLLEIVDLSGNTSYKATPNFILGFTGGSPVSTTDTQVLTNKTLTAPAISAPVLSGTLTGTYTIGGTPTFPATVVSTTGIQTLTNKTLTSPAITGGTIANPTLTVDSIAEFTASNGVTVSGLNIKTGKLNTNNSVVTANITDTAVTPAKLQAGSGTGWAWQSYTPTFTNLTSGNGTLAFKYTQIGKTVIVNISFKLGTTSSMGSVPTMSLPVTSVSYTPGRWMGGVRMVAGAQGYSGYVQWISTTAVTFLAMNASGTFVSDSNWSATVPNTWVTNDSFDGYIIYEAA